MDVIVVTSAGFCDYVSRFAQDREYIRGRPFYVDYGPTYCRHCDGSPAGQAITSCRSGLVPGRAGGLHRTPGVKEAFPVNPPGVTIREIPAVAAAGKRLHVAMIAPPYFDIPPTAYGGIEAVVADLVDALVDRDHEVTLIGAGRHRTRAHRFLATYHQQPADQLGEPLPEVVHAAQVARLLEDLDADVVHDHTVAGPLLARGRVAPTVVTVHGPATGEPGMYYSALGSTVGLVAISDAQRAKAPGLPWAATVHNAIRTDTFPFRAEKDEFALFLGRFHPDKAPHLAVEAARAAKLPIVLAGKCAEPAERAYFTREVEPRLGPDTTMFGVADAAAKRDLLARAACLVFPICWDEPFGLVVIEAMACGTPVVALRRGAAPELILPGQTGVIVDHPSELAGAIDEARRLDPWICRKHVQQNFTPDLMAAAYEAVYRRSLAVSVAPGTVPALVRRGPASAVTASTVANER